MEPKEILDKWINAFNNADVEALGELYAADAVNHQVPNEAINGRAAIKQMFTDELANAIMVCIPENIFQDGQWVILEWRDPMGLRGCDFFHIAEDKIIFQRCYWDKLFFMKLHDQQD
ncbi:MAG: nuclear transport factor 2 family protein [Ferruginibacter sp.]